MPKEIEITFPNINVNEMREKLEKLGLKNRKPRSFMKRKTFHFCEDKKCGRRRWARVRDEGDKITMTIKDMVGCGINDTCEGEVTINDFECGVEIVKMFGMEESAYQETYREEWVDNGGKVFITIDEWPFLEPLMEIEGKTEEIVREYAEKLGFDFDRGLIGDVALPYSIKFGKPMEYFYALPRIVFDMSLDEFLNNKGEK